MNDTNDSPEKTDTIAPPKPPPVSVRMVPAPDGSMAPLFAAKAKARLAFKPIVRSRKVTVEPMNSKAYTFWYAPLDVVREAVDQALAENGLDLWHVVCTAPDLERELHTYLTHASGAMVEMVIVLPRTKITRDGEKDLTIQEVGSAITYWSRYCDTAVLGVASEDDDDGNSAVGNEVKEREDKPQGKRRTPPEPPARPQEPPRNATTPPPPVEPQKPASVPPGPLPTGSEPCTEELKGLLKAQCNRLKKNPAQAGAICLERYKKKPGELTQQEGLDLLAFLREQPDPEAS